MSIMDDYKQLRMIENIKNFKEMEIAYKANLKLCKYQEQQINKLATCIEQIKKIAEPFCNACQEFEPEKKGSNCMYCNYGKILQKISEVEKWQINR